MPPHASASSAAQAMFHSTKYETTQQEPGAIVSRSVPLLAGSVCHSRNKQGVEPEA